jgi:UDP-glucuronate 4-epimerase
MARVLITGAAGFIGMHTSIRFLKDGWEVFGIDNMNDYYPVQLKKDRLSEIYKLSEASSFNFIQADITSNIWESLEKNHFDAVVHLAAQAGVRYSLENPFAYLQSNIIGFQKVIEFVEKKQIGNFLYASSSSVYGNNSTQPFNEAEECNSPESYYAATKKSNELMAHAYFKTKRVSSIGLRFFTVYGPWGRPDMAPILFANSAVKEKNIKVFNYGNQKRDFTYVDDIVEGIYQLVKQYRSKNVCKVVNIGKGSPEGLMQFISEIEKAMGCQIGKDYVEAQKGDVEVTYADTTLLKQEINYSPEISLEDGIVRFINWYNAYYT